MFVKLNLQPYAYTFLLNIQFPHPHPDSYLWIMLRFGKGK